MNNFSQNKEQDIILDYFRDFTGTFIDIGANDGETFSNSRALALLGWKGVLVEPSPRAFQRLKKLYQGHKGLYVYEFALGSHNGKEMLQESGPQASPTDVGLVSTFHPHEKARFEKVVQYTPVEVKVLRWKTFLNRLTLRQFDFVTMDCEGSETDILPEMDLSEVKMLCIEWNGNPSLKEQYEKHLDGFNLVYTSPENLIYAK